MISYKFLNSNLTWNDRYHEARDNWNGTAVPGTIVFDSANPDPSIEIVSGSYASESFWAQTTGGCAGGGATWAGNEVTITNNMTTIGGLTNQNLRWVAIHELGHAYGIDHVPTSCAGTTKNIMSQGAGKFACTGTPPFVDDQNGVIARY